MSRLVLVVTMAGLAAGCSSGNIRLGGTPLFAASNSAEATAMAPIESSDLPPSSLAPTNQISTTSRLAARGYTLENAPIVEIGPADTAATLSTGFGVPVDVILEANGLSSVSEVQPGRRLIIPVKAPANTLAAAAESSSPIAVSSASYTTGAPPSTLNAQAAEGRHVVQPGDTLWSISTAHRVAPEKVIALNGLPANGSVQVGQTLRIPGSTLAGATATTQPAPTQVASLGGAPTLGGAPATPVTAAPASPQPAAQAQPAAPQTPAPTLASLPKDPAPAAAPAGAASGFRWPVQGRIIAGFGKQADGARNDGINLAVPAGTPVRAAESGTVIYAGNELEGYGNLILVQHADDWVSAYAHNETLTVSRGDKVTRGQTIANVGKTGSVEQPQLHFELRKKSKPVDPLPHLAGA